MPYRQCIDGLDFLAFSAACDRIIALPPPIHHGGRSKKHYDYAQGCSGMCGAQRWQHALPLRAALPASMLPVLP